MMSSCTTTRIEIFHHTIGPNTFVFVLLLESIYLDHSLHIAL